MLDRDFGNQYVSRHNNTFYGGIWLGATIYRNKDTPPTSVPYVFWGSTNDTTCRSMPTGFQCDPAGGLEYGRLEGFEYAGLTFQGARAVDSSSGQWTTPDAYAGNVHDPMSQKAFMWDRNNPYAYADPSGFAPHDVLTVDPERANVGMSSAGMSADVAVAGPQNSTNALWYDLNNAIILAYEHESTKNGFNSHALAEIIGARLEKQGYSVGVSTDKGRTVRVDVRDPRSSVSAQLSLNGRDTNFKIFYQNREVRTWNSQYRWFGPETTRGDLRRKFEYQSDQTFRGAFLEGLG